MRNKLILGFLIIVGIGFFSYIGESRKTYVIEVNTSKEATDVILAKSRDGWKLISLTAYSGTTTFVDDFIIVMEK